MIVALDDIHSENIVHKDIKPENILIDNKGYIHVTDFGVSHSISDKSKKGGTLGYMAPEILKK